jgi:hypothetical protein
MEKPQKGKESDYMDDGREVDIIENICYNQGLKEMDTYWKKKVEGVDMYRLMKSIDLTGREESVTFNTLGKYAIAIKGLLLKEEL